ncbi:cytochrome-c peroxidase [Chitinophaga sp. LS1]|uniref:cytochrome-c peroxidase n=1 Tax=Chitinophaga sp. LS1 TaxID=3051176 RepID=UPI002AAAA3DE|nr:cytochrome c peroxidase [Chitinophaga sp. LS1]WPV63781.1 cytochrome c peroxidase [Chitinophaga sp. LS1]
MRILICIFTLAIIACSKTQNTPAAVISIPGYFPALPATPDNPLTKEGIELGRLLFYDTRLSGNNKLSCASCHQQNLAFTDGVALSDIGVSGKQLHRSAPALINLAWATNGLFWEGGSTNLESQALGPLTSEDEMHQNLYELISELNEVPEYVRRFKSAFNSEITTANILKALSQFERTLISANSAYDQQQLNIQEQKGLTLFNNHCRSCHSGVLFTDNSFHNNGIDSDFSSDALEGIYQGRFRITYDSADLGKFKTPTLRNIALTAPYMHDGRFADLFAVLQHYSNGIKHSPTTDTILLNKEPLSSDDQTAIIAFLHTLTDTAFIHNTALKQP